MTSPDSRHRHTPSRLRDRLFFSHREELWNAWSHAGGIVMGVAAGAVKG